MRSPAPFTGVLRGLGLKVPHGVLFEQFWAPGSECPKECFLSVFLAFFGPKTPKKTLKKHFWGTLSQVPRIAQKALRGALSGALSTPVNGAGDRNSMFSFLKGSRNVRVQLTLTSLFS